MSSKPKVVIVVPWRGGQEDRDRIWRAIKPYWQALQYPIIEADSGADHFDRGASQNRGAELGGDWDVMLVLDADVLVPYKQVRRGVQMAYDHGTLVLPHTTLTGLTLADNDEALPLIEAGMDPWRAIGKQASSSHVVGGLQIVSRAIWEEVGPYDTMAGQNMTQAVRDRTPSRIMHDWLYVARCRQIGKAEERVPGTLVHFFHGRPDVALARAEREAKMLELSGLKQLPPPGTYAYHKAAQAYNRWLEKEAKG